MLGKGQQEGAFELSLETAGCYLEARGMTREGTGRETGVVCGGYEEGRDLQSGQTAGRASGEAGEADRSV